MGSSALTVPARPRCSIASARLYQPSKGDILLEGESILKRPAHKISEIGIGRTFQNVALFPNLSVLDNVRVGAHARTNRDILSDSPEAALGAQDREAEINRSRSMTFSVISNLHDVAHTSVVAGLPFGTQKRVELARASGGGAQDTCCWTNPPAASTMRKSTSSAI